jgi:hypothetical protein
MLFLSYWELNENMSESQRLEIAEKLTRTGLFPPPGVKVIRWDETPDGWGILLVESDSAIAVTNMLAVWRFAGAGFFKMTKTAPAYPINEANMAQFAELHKALGAG